MGSHAQRTASALVPLLKDDTMNVRHRTAWALGTIGDELAVEPLIECLLDKDDTVRAMAADSLKLLTGEDLGEDHARWKEWFGKKG
jgi:HEAT repeat protein